MRALHWPDGAHADQLRYSQCNHLGSSTLELDHQAGVLTQEHYYAFGGTACWAGRSALVAKYKTIRYSGQERDATGLYYYGYRYYAPWLQRWISPDPVGSVDGLNLYQMVLNNPVGYCDWQGGLSVPVDIFITDIVNPMAKTIGTGWFEELVWSDNDRTFDTTGFVYGRGMRKIDGEPTEWAPVRSSEAAIALFRDPDKKLRIFVNNYQQHMGIQPGMGLPEFAGLLAVDEHDSSRFIVNNHSGHYKPESSIEVEAMIREISPGQPSVRYVPIRESPSFDSALQITSIDSPEMYERLVNKFRTDFNGLIEYLKEQNVWESAKEKWANEEGMNIIFKMDDHGLTSREIHGIKDESRNLKISTRSAADAPQRPVQVMNKKPSRPRSSCTIC